MVRFCARRLKSSSRRRTGSIVVLAAALLVVVLGMIALAIDTGAMMVRRSEMQRNVDAAVLAATSILAQAEVTEAEVVAEAIEFLTANGVDPDELDEDDLTIEFGGWDAETRQFTTTGFDGSSAIRVAIQQTGNGLFFGRILGVSTHDIAAEAIAIAKGSIERDIMLTLDCSGSMDNDSKNPEQPMTAVKDGAQVLCDTVLPNDRVGLTVYNWEDPELDHKTGHVEVALTGTTSIVKTRINDLTAKFYTGGTNIAGGIHIGGESLNVDARAGVRKELIVLTDGKANKKEPPYTSGYSPDESAIAWANDIRALGIIIHTISVGNGADHELMAEIAGDSLAEEDPLKGMHFAIEGSIEDYTVALEAAFEELGTGAKTLTLVH